MIHHTACTFCGTTDVTFIYDRQVPTRVDLGDNTWVDLPARDRAGTLRISCSACGRSSTHRVPYFDPPEGDARWTVNTKPAAGL
jgi:hypothetical protein